MQLELTAQAEAAASIGRLKALAASRDGRARTQAVKIVWHDSPEHALWADGLALSDQRGRWRLERAMPGPETWLPAQPPPLVTDAPDLAALPSPLAPLAAFEGRRTISVHRFGEDVVSLTVERGILRSVTAEQPVARILLSGEEAVVRTAALLISNVVPAEVPVVSLAAEAIGLATGRVPRARHRGAPVLPDAEIGVHEALAHIIGHLTDVVFAYAPFADRLDDVGAEAVHQMRVAVRRARSAMSIFRPIVEAGALETVNASLKALGKQLGPSRDWDVLVDETIPVLQDALTADQRLERLASAATRRRQTHRAGLTAYLAGADFRKLGIELALFAASSSWHVTTEEPTPTLAAFGSAVLQHRWKKLVGAGKRMEELDVPGLHAVRLRAKRARYAAEMFSAVFPGKAAQRFIHRLSNLQQRLGVMNDGAVATHLLEELGGANGRHAFGAGVVAGFMAARAGTVRPRIVLAFEKFRRQPIYWA